MEGDSGGRAWRLYSLLYKAYIKVTGAARRWFETQTVEADAQGPVLKTLWA